MRDMLIMYPTTKSIWCHLPNTTRYRIMEFFLVIFYHAIPGFLYDCVLKFTKNPRRLLPLYRKTHLFMVRLKFQKKNVKKIREKFTHSFSFQIKLRYFMTQEWKFNNENMYAVYDRYDLV